MKKFIGFTILLVSAVLLGACATDAQTNAAEEKCTYETKRVYQPYGGGGGGSFFEMPVRKCGKGKRGRNNSGKKFDPIPAKPPQGGDVSYLFPDLTAAEISSRYQECATPPSEEDLAQYILALYGQKLKRIPSAPLSPPPPFSIGRLCVDLSRTDGSWSHWNQALMYWSGEEKFVYRLAVPLAAIDMPEAQVDESNPLADGQNRLVVIMHSAQEFQEKFPDGKGVVGITPATIRRDFERGNLYESDTAIVEYDNIRLQHYPYALGSGSDHVPLGDFLLSDDLNIICDVAGYFRYEEYFQSDKFLRLSMCRIFDEKAEIVIVLIFPRKITRRSAEIVSIALDQIRKTIVFEGGE